MGRRRRIDPDGGTVMRSRTRIVAGALVAGAAVAAVVGGVVAAGGGGDDDRPITGAALDRASAAALEHTGEGRVTGTEEGDEDSYYEVEVTLEDGSQVVQLDRDFRVVGADVDRPDDGEGGDTD
jgi:hypothetical protein